MTWNTIATLEINQDWQLTPIVAPELGYIRLSFATAGIPVMIAQIDPVTGDLSDQRRIMATPRSQVLSFEFPPAFSNRAIALRLPVPATPFEVQVELSSVPIAFDGAEVNLQPVLNGQSQILRAIDEIDVPAVDLQPVLSAIAGIDIDVPAVDLQPVLSGQSQILLELQSLDVSIDPAIITGIQSLQTKQNSQSTALGQIQSTQTNHSNSLSAIAQAQSSHTTAIQQLQAQIQSLAAPPTAHSLITTAYTPSQSAFWSASGIPGTHAALTDNQPSTGAVTGGGNNHWIKATFATAQTVRAIRLGAGNLGGWGGTSAFLNGNQVQYSTDDQNWLSLFVISGMNDTTHQFITFTLPQAVVARFWRIFAPTNGVAVTEFRFLS